MQQIQLNIIPFTPAATKLSFPFYDKQPGFAPIHWERLFETFPEGRDAAHKYYYSDFQPPREDAIVKEIDLEQCIGFAIHYFRYLILSYFKTLPEALVFPNFAKDVEVWFPDHGVRHPVYKQYLKYSIKVKYAQVSCGYELVLAYNGTSKILHTSLQDIDDIPTEDFNLINCHGTIYKYDKIPLEFKQDLSQLFPVVSNPMKPALEIPADEIVFENRFPKFLRILQAFYNAYLNTPAFKEIIPLSPNGFWKVDSDYVFKTSQLSNELEFGQGTDINPGLGILRLRPYRGSPHAHIKFFFIYHKPDGMLIKNTIYEYFANGFNKQVKGVDKKFKKMRWYINQQFNIDKGSAITFENTETAFEEVAAQIKVFNKVPNVKYVAIYISPFPKTETDSQKHAVYYRLKELLLYEQITSQVIYREHLPKEEFYYFLPNIEIAILAKIDGIPWRLSRTRADEIIIGVGAFKPQGHKHRFVGSAFCFSNDGRFEGFNCFRSDDTVMLAGSIRDAVDKFIDKYKEAKRVIIHFYKEMSDREELQPILDMLGTLGAGDIPVIVVTVNKTDSRELLGFDMASTGKMPYSGTYVKVGPNQFLLFNNTRYMPDSKIGAKDWHFPIKLSMRATNSQLLQNYDTIRELIDQVYQFSRMYWKSISQQNLPVTTRYPEMVAEIYPHFQHDRLPDFAQSNLWFL